MEYISLQNSDLNVSRICMGGCPMGQYGWGQVDEKKLIRAVEQALEEGVNFFDTADTYGLGTSEKTLAKALGSKRQEAVIADKFGVRVENGHTFYDNSPEWIEQALEGSLKRLNTDYIDLYQIHYRDNKTPIGEVVETLERMKKKGISGTMACPISTVTIWQSFAAMKGSLYHFRMNTVWPAGRTKRISLNSGRS